MQIPDRVHLDWRSWIPFCRYLKGRVVGFALWKENCSNIFCVSDSLHAVQLIKQQVQGCHAYAAIVEHIRDFLEGGVEAFSASVQMP